MTAFIYNNKTGSVFAVLFWILSILLFLLNISDFIIIMLIPMVLAWSSNLLIISFLILFFCSTLYVLSKKARWKSRLFIVLLFFSAFNTFVSTIVFFKSKSVELNSNLAKDSLNKALHDINKQLQNTEETK